MKRAYSIKLGCLVDARDCDYDDCLEYEIVCEVCRHRVFKGVRHSETGDVHYLSHYAAQSAEAKECELRVAAAIASEGSEGGEYGLGHGQSLSKRLVALKWVLHDSLAWNMQVEIALKLMNGVPTTVEYRKLRSVLIKLFIDLARDPDECMSIFEDISLRLQTIRAQGDEMNDATRDWMTTLGRRTQIRWAMDMLRTIVLKESLPQLLILADFAWAFAIELTMESRDRDDDQRTSDSIITMLLATPYRCEFTEGAINSFDDRVVDHDDRPGLHDETTTVGGGALMRVRYEMMRLLFLIDYTAPLPKGATKAVAREKLRAEKQLKKRRRK